ncbi:MAG TPA: TlpA family protein disulfide reductase [Candidatus Acidoferrales bacterium]|jgi:thiol-disulfide isomerase/thioredoxin|nr:TlpA family protein disulfide reductase [Candidatus Acidoferrales bacterium]
MTVMRVRLRILLGIGMLGLILAATLGVARPQTASARAAASNDDSQEMPLLDLGGYKNMIARYHGRPVLVTFWATWCGPCRDEYPMIVSLAKEYGPQGLVVIGVSLDEDADLPLARKFLADAHPGFANYRQKPGTDIDAFYQGVNPDWRGTMPETDFYARDGHLARYFVGQKTRDAFVQAIRLIMIATDSDNIGKGRPSTGN